jgi:hypothetical protein
VNVQNYNDMESQSRRALELFAQDTRQASSLTWNSAASVTLVVDSSTITWTHAGGVFFEQTPGEKRALVERYRIPYEAQLAGRA